MPRSQSERSETTKRAVVAAARALFADRGYDATSMEQLARHAGISKGALYHHYKDKSDVLAAAYEDLEQELSVRILTVASTHHDPIDALRGGAHAFLDACCEPATRRLALIDAPAGLGWRRWREIDARNGFGLLRAGLQVAADQGRIQPDHIVERAHLLLAVLMEASLMIGDADDVDATRALVGGLVDEHIDALVMRKPRARRP
jgi:AcrR family transcriptional regulator